MKASEQILRKNLSDIIYERIKNDIIQSKLVPGERILVDQKAEEMGVSKTPFREALVRLEEDGYVTSIPRGGTYVKKILTQEIKEIYEIREMFEALAGRLLVSTINSAQKDELLKVCQQYEAGIKKRNIKACVSADIKFHSLILDLCNNETLKKMTKSLRLQLKSIMEIGNNYFDFAPIYHQEHLAIVNAISNKEEELVEKLIRSHIANGKSRKLN